MQQARREGSAGTFDTAGAREMTYAQALNLALAEELERDPSVIVLGEDIGSYGGVFGVTRDLQARFGARRVLDTPISETGFLGCAVGAAMCGLRPVVEIMFVDFTLVCMDQIVNQAAKLPYLTGGQVRMPLVFRTQQGARPGTAAQHSQCLEALFAHVPGLRVVAPATPADARGMLKAAIRSDDPVVFLEHKALYATSGQVPVAEHPVPIGKARIARAGSHVTALTYSAMLPIVLAAAEALAGEDISVEVIDLRSLAPLDEATVLESVRRTGHVLVIHEGWRRGGYGAELASLIQDLAFDWLDAPVGRLGARDVPKPFSPAFDPVFLPTADSVAAALRSTLS
jgi:pyruvate/2-oxoglutarate/acetoin dehydrogenase E1 component